MIRFSKGERIFLLSISISFVLFFYIKYLELPELSKLNHIYKDYSNASLLIKSAAASKEEVDNLKSYIQNAAITLKDIPEGPKTSEIAYCFDSFTNITGLNPGILSFLSLEPNSDSQSDGMNDAIREDLNVLSMSYSIKGDYDKLITLLKCIETCPRRMDITGVSMVKGAEDDNFTLALYIKSYCFDSSNNEGI